MTAADLLQTLDRWRDAGWLRSLDVALARFVWETDPDLPASLLLATALVAQLESRGHGALPLSVDLPDLHGLLSWPAEAVVDLRAATASWPADASACALAWGGRAAVQFDPTDDTGASPLVVSGGMLYLRRYWRYERRVAEEVHARTASGDHLPGTAEAAVTASAIDTAAAAGLLNQLFEPLPPGQPNDDQPTDWQKVACALALRGRLTLVTGGPGTGKTFTAARLLVLLQALHTGPQPLRVALAAPTGKAAARLRQSIRQALQGLGERFGTALGLQTWVAQLGPASTLHALLGTQVGTRRFRHDAANPLDVDVLFVDEASMVHLEMMARLLDALPLTARVVLLGDKDQLASVEAGSVMGDLCDGAGQGGAAGGYRPDTAAWIQQLTGQVLPSSELGPGPSLAQQTVVLRHSHRFGGPIGQLSLAVNRGDAGVALELLRADSGGPVALRPARDPEAVVTLALRGRDGAPGGYHSYLEALARRPARDDASTFEPWARDLLRGFDGFRVLCAVRDGPWGVGGLNQAIERGLGEAGLLPGRGEWYEGRPVMVTRNDPSLGVFNGDIGIVLRGPAGDAALRCWFLDGEALRSVSVGRLADVETAFAMTVHKSQGSEFEHVVLVLPDEDLPVLTRELLYTGITRASRAFTLVAPQPALLASATGRRTRRVSGLKRML